MKQFWRMSSIRTWIVWGLIISGLGAACIGVLVGFPEYGAGLRSLLGAPLPSRHESLDPLRWFVTPIEEHAFIRRVVTTAQLNDVAVLGDGRTVIVVGRQGALLRSTNSGATWISIADSVIWNDSVVEGDTGGGQLPSVKPRPSLESVVASADGSLAVAVGSAGTVLTSEDSGQTWIERNSGSSANLTSVAFDAGTGRTIAVGREGTVLVSGDGGQSWTARKSGSSVWLSSVAFNAGTGRAIAVGERGTVLTSGDAGQSWTGRNFGLSAWLKHVAFDADTGRVIAVGDDSTVYTSDDTGLSWTMRYSGSVPYLWSVVLDASTARAIAVGSDGTTLTSDDAGVTWTERNSGSSAGLNAVAFDTDSGLAIAVGEGGTVLTSSDSGNSWFERSSSLFAEYGSVVLDGNTGRAIAVGTRGIVLTSDDAGQSWSERNLGSSAWLYAVALDGNSGRAIAVGSRDTVLSSDDFGQSWVEHRSESSQALYSIVLGGDGVQAIAAGERGTVLISDNGGQSWRSGSSSASEWLWSVAFDPGSERAIAVGDGGTVLISDNAGQSWTARSFGDSERLESVAFDAGTGRTIAVGDSGTVLTSDNAGRSWNERTSGSSAWLRSVAFDAWTDRAIAVGDGGTVLTSDNAGRSWTARNSGSSAWLRSVAFDADSSRVIAVGTGTILTSDDAGATWQALRAHIYPAPIAVAGLLLMLIGLISVRYHSVAVKEREEGAKRIDDVFVSDSPLRAEDLDRLSFNPIAQGLSGFLRNQATGFPITIAVTGEWGTGKSSLMRLLELNLQKNGFLPTWFNAWHDQNEGNILSPLLVAMRKQAFPRIFSRHYRRAIVLRANLLHRRSAVYSIALLAALTLLAFAGSSVWHVWHSSSDTQKPGEGLRTAIRASLGTYEPFYVTDKTIGAVCDELNRSSSASSDQSSLCAGELSRLESNGKKILWSNRSNLREAIEEKLSLPHPGYTVEIERVLLDNVSYIPAETLSTAILGDTGSQIFGKFWQWLAALVTTVALISHGVAAFGFNLRRGIPAALNLGNGGSADPVGRHERLRQDFEIISRSIGKYLVIFIDDLDRCEPEKVVETLEAVNFLVTAGECAIVIGMDYERVRNCVALHRRELADADQSSATPENIRRKEYAHQYLQKLINVEMPMSLDREMLRELLIPRSVASVESGQAVSGWLWLRSLWKKRSWVKPLLVTITLLSMPYIHDVLTPAEQTDEVLDVSDNGNVQETSHPPDSDVGDRDTAGGKQEDESRPVLGAPQVVHWPVFAGLTMVSLLVLVLGARRLIGPRMGNLRDLLRRAERQLLDQPQVERDSQTFKKALMIWSNVALCGDPTARATKRLLNRIRYFAAMLRVRAEGGSDWRHEVNLVALAILHHVNVDLLDDRSRPRVDLFRVEFLKSDMDVSRVCDILGFDSDEQSRDCARLIHEAVRNHANFQNWMDANGNISESPWPPRESEIKQFQKLSYGIHMR